MNRLLIIAKNSSFPRVSARPASNAFTAARPPSPRPDNCEAGLSSGAQPDAATGGTRHSPAEQTSSPPYAPSAGLEVYLPAVIGLCFGWLIVALVTLVLL